jgi:hypothetical protein
MYPLGLPTIWPTAVNCVALIAPAAERPIGPEWVADKPGVGVPLVGPESSPQPELMRILAMNIDRVLILELITIASSRYFSYFFRRKTRPNDEQKARGEISTGRAR